MPIPDEFEYALEDFGSETFTYLAEDSKMFMEHPGRRKSSQSGSRSQITIGNSNATKTYSGNYDLQGNYQKHSSNGF